MLVWAGIQTPPLLKSPFLMFPKKSALTVSLLLFLCCLFSFCDIIPLSRIIWIYLTATFYALVYQNAFWEPSKNRCYTGRKQDTFIDAICIDSYRFRCSLGSKVNQFHLEFCSFLYDLIPPVGDILASFRPPEGFNTFFSLSFQEDGREQLLIVGLLTRRTQAATWEPLLHHSLGTS